MDESLRRRLGDALRSEQARLAVELSEEVEAPGQMTYGSQASAASQVFTQQRDLALREQQERHAAMVQAALDRHSSGAYGLCLSCGQVIAEARLEALPWAELCIDCQRRARVRG